MYIMIHNDALLTTIQKLCVKREKSEQVTRFLVSMIRFNTILSVISETFVSMIRHQYLNTCTYLRQRYIVHEWRKIPHAI